MRMRPIETETDIEAALEELAAADPRLVRVIEAAGSVPLRREPGGFTGLARVVTAQQISTIAAAAIWARLVAAVDPFTPDAFLAAGEAVYRSAGLSRPKVAILTGLAQACAEGFDPDALHGVPVEEALAAMTALKGIGPWTAESYLLFCAGHPDVFPAGDLALQVAVQHGLRMRKRPDDKKLRKLAEKWRPWRGVAARLFWAYYRQQREALREAASSRRRR